MTNPGNGKKEGERNQIEDKSMRSKGELIKREGDRKGKWTASPVVPGHGGREEEGNFLKEKSLRRKEATEERNLDKNSKVD